MSYDSISGLSIHSALLINETEKRSKEFLNCINLNDIENVKQMIEIEPSFVNLLDENDIHVLHRSINESHLDISQLLILKGADLNVK